MTDEEFVQFAREMFTDMYRNNRGEPWAPMAFLLNRSTKQSHTLAIGVDRTDIEIKHLIEDLVEQKAFDAYVVGLEFVQIGSLAENEAIERGAPRLGLLSNLEGVGAKGMFDAKSFAAGADRLFAIFIGTNTGLRKIATFEVHTRKDKAYLGNEQSSEDMSSEILSVFPAPADRKLAP